MESCKNSRKNSLIFIALICFGSWIKVNAQSDPFRSYLNTVPSVISVLSYSSYGTGDSAITVKRFTIGTRENLDTVYAIMAYPRNLPSKHPGLVFLHGGGSKAEDMLYLVKSYAKRGYVTLAFDLPGICNPTKATYSSGKWKTRAAGEAPRFDIGNGLENSTLVDAEITGIEGFNYLCAQKNVDIKNIGITGFSWGGYSTTFLSGILGKRVKAAYAVFGCGYFDKGSFWKKIIGDLSPDIRRKWLRYFDAGRRAGNIKSPYFLEATSNDTYFWPEAVDNTLDAIRVTKNHVWDTNFNHRQMPSGPIMQQLYFDYYLKGIGQSFGTAKIAGWHKLSDGNRKLRIEINEPKGITVASVVLYYSEPAKNWQEGKWIPLNATLKSENVYTVELTANLIKKGIYYYGFVTDNRGVSVSTYMYNSLNFSKVL